MDFDEPTIICRWIYQLNLSSITRAVFFMLLGSTPISTTFTIGVKPILLLTYSSMRLPSAAKSTSPVDST